MLLSAAKEAAAATATATAAASATTSEVTKTSQEEAAGATTEEVDGESNPAAEVAAERVKRALEIRGRLKDSRLPVVGAEVKATTSVRVYLVQQAV